jgi:hypothetical protein
MYCIIVTIYAFHVYHYQLTSFFSKHKIYSYNETEKCYCAIKSFYNSPTDIRLWYFNSVISLSLIIMWWVCVSNISIIIIMCSTGDMGTGALL